MDSLALFETIPHWNFSLPLKEPFPCNYLIVLQQDETEVELAEGQFKVFDIPMLDTFLMGQVEDWLPALSQCSDTGTFLLCIQ